MSKDIVIKPEIIALVAADPRQAAIKVIEILNSAGHNGYFVGGCVRDEYLDHNVSDYDVTTSAMPDQIKLLFHITSSESEQYGIIRVFIPDTPVKSSGLDFKRTGGYASGNWIETCTYRCSNGSLPSVDFTATLEADTSRRDFTVNAMYLNPITGDLIDFVGGQTDLINRRLRVIGIPVQRFHEDPLRILRAIRLSISSGLTPDSECLDGIRETGMLLKDRNLISGLKLNQELNKVITKGILAPWYTIMLSLDLIKFAYPIMGGIPVDMLERFDSYMARVKDEGNKIAMGVSRKRRIRADTSVIMGLAVITSTSSSEIVVAWCRSLGYSQFFIDEITFLHTHASKIDTLLSDTVYTSLSNMSSLDELLIFYVLKTGNVEGKDRFMKEINRVVSELRANSQKRSSLLTGTDLTKMGYPRGELYKVILSKLAQRETEGIVKTKEEAYTWVRSEYPL